MKEKILTDEEIIEAYFYKCKEQSCENCSLGDIENCMTYVEDLIKRLQSKTEWLKKERDDMHNDVIQAEEYAESLKKQNEKLKQQVESQRKIIEYHDSLQDEVAMLKEERENMQAEIMRFEDMKFTQEHCDLYEENKWLKECLQQAVKDTADKIFRQVLRLYQGLSKVEKETMAFEWKLLDLAVEYGVEME